MQMNGWSFANERLGVAGPGLSSVCARPRIRQIDAAARRPRPRRRHSRPAPPQDHSAMDSEQLGNGGARLCGAVPASTRARRSMSGQIGSVGRCPHRRQKSSARGVQRPQDSRLEDDYACGGEDWRCGSHRLAPVAARASATLGAGREPAPGDREPESNKGNATAGYARYLIAASGRSRAGLVEVVRFSHSG